MDIKPEVTFEYRTRSFAITEVERMTAWLNQQGEEGFRFLQTILHPSGLFVVVMERDHFVDEDPRLKESA